jgi:hypothetical protein
MTETISGSFRDPSGFLFSQNKVIYRQVNQIYRSNYDKLMRSGLYEHLTKSGAMVKHREVDGVISPNPDIAYKIIQPELIDFISYPYEWCFSQIKEAAILTLAIAKRALEYGMSLKDASAFNIQFKNGRAIFIDSLSFETYQEGEPWVAYRQFCQHFLAPLALMAFCDIRLNQLLRTNIDGVPLDITSKLLPFRTRLNIGLLTHIHLHAKSQQRFADKALKGPISDAKVNKQAILGLIESLISTVKKLKVMKFDTEWNNYYQITNYSSEAFEAKKDIIHSFLSAANPNSVWDLGANTGEFSRIASERGIKTIAFDIDHGAVEKNYRHMKENQEENILPLVMDLTNPSPSLGWHHNERNSLIDRGPVDLALALALVHHLAIGNNVPLNAIAAFFSDLCEFLIIEFVPKTDSQVELLLSSREDIFPNYTINGFEVAFKNYFNIIEKKLVANSKRTLYLMKKIGS